MEGLTKQFSRAHPPSARLRSELLCMLMLYFRGCDLILAFDKIVNSLRTGDLFFLFIVSAQEIRAVSILTFQIGDVVLSI